jgi:hypothetical protein
VVANSVGSVVLAVIENKSFEGKAGQGVTKLTLFSGRWSASLVDIGAAGNSRGEGAERKP